jgi:outer membrane lipoprotein LolB
VIAVFHMFRAGLLCALLILLAGCAQPPQRSLPVEGTEAPHYWRGRLSLRLETPEPSSFYAGFELMGQPHAGELVLTSPLGSTLAKLRWSPEVALLQNGGQTRAFGSLDALATEATGTAIPITALFEWLEGRPAAADGWQADLSLLADGRLVARRTQPAPAAELRLILEQP